MKFIKLTGYYDGGSIHYIQAKNIERIKEVNGQNAHTEIFIYNAEYPKIDVKESPEEILKLIESWDK